MCLSCCLSFKIFSLTFLEKLLFDDFFYEKDAKLVDVDPFVFDASDICCELPDKCVVLCCMSAEKPSNKFETIEGPPLEGEMS